MAMKSRNKKLLVTIVAVLVVISLVVVFAPLSKIRLAVAGSGDLLSIYIDDKLVDIQSINGIFQHNYSVRAGSHTVSVGHDGFIEFRKTVSLLPFESKLVVDILSVY